MKKSLKSPSKFDSSEHRLVLLWLLFLFTVILVSPTIFASPMADDDMAPMSCGGMGCQQQDCGPAPEMPGLDEFTIPPEDSASARSLALLPGSSMVLLYAAAEPLSLSLPIQAENEISPVFEPLRVMGPAHAAHAPPVA